jgi:hypothetical protein
LRADPKRFGLKEAGFDQRRPRCIRRRVGEKVAVDREIIIRPKKGTAVLNMGTESCVLQFKK